MKQHVVPFTKFINEEFRVQLAPTHEELENLDSFRRLCQIGTIIDKPKLPQWTTLPRAYAAGNRTLIVPWKHGAQMTGENEWTFTPATGALRTSIGMEKFDYSTELGWSQAIDSIIIKYLVDILMYETVGEPVWSEYRPAVGNGELDKIFEVIGVGIGDAYDTDRIRRLLELVYQPISDGEMIRALSGAPVQLTRINQ